MSEAKVDLTVQDGGAVSAWDRYRAALEAVLNVDRQRASEDKKAAQAAAELGRIKSRVLGEIETKEEKLKARMIDINRLRDAGRLTEDQYMRAVARTRQQLMEVTQQQTAHGQAGASGLETMALKYVSITAALGAVKTGVQWWMQANKELLDQANELGNKYDTMQRRFQVQAGLSGLQAEEAQQKILQQAIAGGNTREEAAQASVAMASTGFDSAQITGGGLREVLKLYNAQTVSGENVDLGQMTESISRYLESQGLDKTEANVQMLGEKIQGLKETPIKITDLQFLAKNAAGLRGKVSIDDQLASFAQLMGSFEGSEAGTTMRNVASRLATAGSMKDSTAALKKLKLKPEDVDLVGETLDEAIAKVKAGAEALPEKDRENALVKIFDREALPAFNLLANDAAKREQLKKDMNRGGLVEADAAVFENGRAAADRKLKLQEELAVVARDDQGDLDRRALRTEMLESGRSAIYTDAALKVTDAARYAGAGLGVSPDTAGTLGLAAVDSASDYRSYLGWAGRGMKALGLGGGDAGQATAGQIQYRAKQRRDEAFGPEAADPAVGEMQRQNELVERQNKTLESIDRKLTPNGAPRPNTLPTGPRPASTLATKP